jgi:glycosyltransferase involved in cell wall biosynthesis
VLRPVIPARSPIVSLPVPSNVPRVNDIEAVNAIRSIYAPSELLAGHFGTYGAKIREYLELAIPELVSHPNVSVVLIGRGSASFHENLIRKNPGNADRIHSTGELDQRSLSLHLNACDLMLQPYPDGISTRRTSVMASLAHGRPIVTTNGHLTEPLWSESHAVATVPTERPEWLAPHTLRLLNDRSERYRLGMTAARLYEERFDLRHTLSSLRSNAYCTGQLDRA